MYREYLVQHPVEAACLLKNDSAWRLETFVWVNLRGKNDKVEHACCRVVCRTRVTG